MWTSCTNYDLSLSLSLMYRFHRPTYYRTPYRVGICRQGLAVYLPMMSLWACLCQALRESGYVTYWGHRRNPVPGSVVGPRDPGMYIVLGSRNAHASWCPEVRDSSMDSRAFEGWPQAAARMHLAPWLDHAACCRIAHAAWPRASAYTLQLL